MNEMFAPKLPTLIYMCGHRGAGKTYSLIQLFVNEQIYYQQFDKIFVFSPSLGDVNDNNLFDLLGLPKRQLFDKFDEKILDKIIKAKRKKPEEQWAIIFDDVIGDTHFKNSELSRTICLNGRHMNISMFVTSQRSTLGSTSLRTNADACFFWRPRSGNEIDAIYRDSCINGISKKKFTKLLMDNTKDKHDFLMINYTNNTCWNNFTKVETPTYDEF